MKKRLNGAIPKMMSNQINFDELLEQTERLYKIHLKLKEYVVNEAKIIKTNNNISKYNLEECETEKERILYEIAVLEPELEDKIIELGNMKAHCEYLSAKILLNFQIFRNVSVDNQLRVDASNENNELNDEFKLKIKEYANKYQDLLPIFRRTGDKIYERLFLSIFNDKSFYIIKDVLIQYEKFINGEKTAKQCIDHGKNFVESNFENAPKGLFDKFKK